MAIKRRACGYRNPEHFKTAIYFFCGGLAPNPRTLDLCQIVDTMANGGYDILRKQQQAKGSVMLFGKPENRS